MLRSASSRAVCGFPERADFAVPCSPTRKLLAPAWLKTAADPRDRDEHRAWNGRCYGGPLMAMTTCCLDPRLEPLLKLRDALRLELHLLTAEARAEWQALELALIRLGRRIAAEGQALGAATRESIGALARQFAELRATAAA